MTWLDTINTIEDLPTDQLQPGAFYWLHGAKQAKQPGCFYVKASEIGDPPAAPWQVDNRFDDEIGFSAPELRIAVIAWRSQWYTQEDQKKPKVWLSHYEQGAKKHTDFLCFAEGIDAAMVLSADGMNKEKPLSEIVKAYRAGLLTQASRIAKRALPLWTFWLPIANKRRADGAPDFIEATDSAGKKYGSVVTPPALYLPDDAMESCFVGEDILRRGADVARSYTEWTEAKRLPPNTVEAEVLALPPGKNVPQPYVAEVDVPDSALPF